MFGTTRTLFAHAIVSEDAEGVSGCYGGHPQHPRVGKERNRVAVHVGRFVVAFQCRRVEGVRIARMPGRESEKEQVPRAYVGQ